MPILEVTTSATPPPTRELDTLAEELMRGEHKDMLPHVREQFMNMWRASHGHPTDRADWVQGAVWLARVAALDAFDERLKSRQSRAAK
mgnify:CR=1 FL=1